LRSVFSEQIDSHEVGRDALQYWAETMNNFLQHRDELPTNRFCDVHYADIRKDPVAVARQVYEHFDWQLSDGTEQRMRTVLANQPAEESGHHRYDPAQFGLNADQVASCFSVYCDRFGLTGASAPVKTNTARPAAAS
jgi:hypothetical protein